jgi:CRISPR/Cas system Type II protein with McrA/HNH and RuvC-like nuclease domain
MKMSKYLTGDRNLDTEIILNLKDNELESVCKVNKSIRDICESYIFWYRRIAKRIEYAKNENFKLYKELKIIPINGEGISEMREYFGFKKLKELNDYLNNFLPKALYQIYFSSLTKLYDKGEDYKIKKELLPNNINYDELLCDIRKQHVKIRLKPRDYMRLDDIDIPKDIPGVFLQKTFLTEKTFSIFKKLEII